MNPPAQQILAMTVHRALGSRMKYRSSHTNQVRTGTILNISGTGLRVINSSGLRVINSSQRFASEFVPWGAILEIVKGEV